MRPSALKHPLAVLRKEIGMLQKEFADLVGRSEATIQSIELGPERLALSEKLAVRIAEETGVGLGFLLAGSPKVPITCENGKAYTKQDFEKHRVALKTGKGPEAETRFGKARALSDRSVVMCHIGILGAMLEAISHNKVESLVYRLMTFMAELKRDFGLNIVAEAVHLWHGRILAEGWFRGKQPSVERKVLREFIADMEDVIAGHGRFDDLMRKMQALGSLDTTGSAPKPPSPPARRSRARSAQSKNKRRGRKK